MTLVCCAAKNCGAMRSDEWDACFCGETKTVPAPPPRRDPKTLLDDRKRADVAERYADVERFKR